LANITDIYDSNGRKIEADTLTMTGENSLHAKFDVAQSGTILCTPIGNLEAMESIIEDLWLSKLIVGNEEEEYEYPVVRVREEGIYIYAEYNIPNNIEIDPITFMKIQNINTNEVLIVTECSDICKLENFELNVFYRINKQRL
jgi:hypothetical protein